MKQLPSHDFRKTYARLREAVDVTSNGHVIGTYYPSVVVFGNSATVQGASDTPITAMSPKDRDAIAVMSQKERDRILRRVSKSS